MSVIFLIKKILYCEIILSFHKRLSISFYILRKAFILLLCLKLLIDPFLYSPVKAQDNFNLVQLQSSPVSFNTSFLPSAITLGSLPVSFTLNKSADFIKLSSQPVSFNTSILPSVVTLSSKPVSYTLSQTADLVKLSSLPVSYSLNSFTGEAIKLTSSNVSYKIFNGVPILESVSPNLLPVLEDSRSIDVALKGNNFVNGSVVTIGTIKINTKYNSAKELIATIPANYLNKENSFELYVANPPPKGSVSEGLNVMVIDPIPIAKINAAPGIGVAPQIVTFDGRDTEDLLAKYFGQELSFSWNFGNGENNTATGETSDTASAVTTHVYEKPGKYTVTLDVLNAYGKTSKVTKEIEIREKNYAPEGTFEASLTNGDVPLSVSFTSMVTDTENDEIKYEWNFGDGQTAGEKNPLHTYTTPGKYQPKLTVTDALGAKTTITSVKLTLLPPNNFPVVQLAAVPDESTLKPNKENIFTSIVQFVTSGTFDPDGEELIYSWNFGDGENETANENNPKHEYKNAGTYNVKLTTTDLRKGQTVKEIKVSVLKPEPIANAIIDETSGTAPFEINLDISGSHDFDGRQVDLVCDFGDGQTKTVNSAQGIVKHRYEDPGVYQVSILAKTPDNRSSKVNIGNIFVDSNNMPVAQIVKLEGENKGLLGKTNSTTVKLSAAGSYDPLNKEIPLKYKWSWIVEAPDNEGNWHDSSKEINEKIEIGNNAEIFEYTFNLAGNYTPVLEVEKLDGIISKFFGETFTITNEQAPVAVAKVVKVLNENLVSEPGMEFSFDGSESYDPKAGGGIKLFSWDFGDGEKSNEISPKHVYNKEGNFTPKLVVVDNENNIGFAQTASIKIVNSESAQTLSRKVLLQTTGEELTEPVQTEEELNDLVDSMIKEATSSFVSFDNKKPQVGPVTIEPKSVKPGEVVKLSTFVRDDIALSGFGYSLIDSNEKIISQKVIDFINQNEDHILKDEYYIEEEIQIPDNLSPGNYKIKLTASDSVNNQIAKANDNSNEEITVNLEITSDDNSTEIISGQDKIIEGTEEEVSEVINRDYVIARSTEETKNFFVRGRRTLPEDLKWEDKKSSIRFLTVPFEVIEISEAPNPWVSITPGKNNTLEPDVVKDSDGEIIIGLKGSLLKQYFGNWVETNVYIDGKKTGSIWWASAVKITFDANKENTRKSVQFRPVNRWGKEMPRETWTGGNFTFTKILPPQITSIFPKEQTEGRGSFDLRVDGSNFRESTKVFFDNYQITPYAVSSNVLLSRIPANFVKSQGVKSVYVLNPDGSQSTVLNYTVKPNEEIKNICKVNYLPQRILASDQKTILSGNNTYLTTPNITIEGNGSVTIPFCIDDEYEVRAGLNISHTPISPKCNYVTYRLDGMAIGFSEVCNTGNKTQKTLDDIFTEKLTNGLHTLEITFHGAPEDELIVKDLTLLNYSGPVISTISPESVSQEGQNRKLLIRGKNFTKDTIVSLEDKVLQKENFTDKEITISLPDRFQSAGNKTVLLTGNNKKTSYVLKVRDKVKIEDGSFKISPVEPFPGNSFDVELTVKDDTSSLPNAVYTAYIGVIDPDGKLLTIPNVSNNFSTIAIDGIKEGNSLVTFKGSVLLPHESKPGNYKVFAGVLRNLGQETDYSSIEVFKYFTSKALGFNTNDTLISPSHTLTFTPKPSVVNIFGIEEGSGNKVLQDGQSINLKTEILNGSEHLSKLRFNFKSGDGRESGLTTETTRSFTYENMVTSSTVPLTYLPKLEVYWVENGSQTKIATHNGPNVFVYPNYKPIAKTRVFSEEYPTYAINSSLMTGFIDSGSYDPNQLLSSAIDYVDSKYNRWEIVQTGFNQVEKIEKLITPPIDSKISEDKKTFYSGTLKTPGVYFAKLTVQDQTGQTDIASTESVTVTLPHQRLIVFATTDPSDKKVFDPSTVILSTSEGSPNGVPVKFMSEITALGGTANISYLWDFGDGSCSRTGELPSDCTDPNPTHLYYDQKRSFNSRPFVDRKSVTPRLKVSANFSGGHKETREVSAGTITFNGDPHFLLLDIKGDQTSGIVPFTVNLKIDSNTAKLVNATVMKYEIDFGEVIASAEGTKQSPSESGEISFSELLTKTFTHTYLVPGSYTPKLKIYIKESIKVFEFTLPTITTSGTGVGGIYLLDDLSIIKYTNQPIVTFKVLTVFPNPNDLNNSLKIKVKDEEGNETTTELDPASQNQTISISEGKNSYYFEISDSTGWVIKTEAREIILDTIDPAISNVSASINSEANALVLRGNVVERNHHKTEVQIDNGIPLILSSDDQIPVGLENLENDEYSFSTTLINIPDTYHNIILKTYDLAGNVAESEFEINKQNNTVLLKENENKSRTELSSPGSVSNYPEHLSNIHEIQRTVISGEPFDLKLKTCFSDDTSKNDNRGVSANFEIESHKVEVSKNGSNFKDITGSIDDLSGGYINRCINIQDYGIQYKTLNCTDSEVDILHCKDTCTTLNGHLCNVNVLSTSQTLNKFENYTSLFNPENDIVDLTKQWDVSRYALKFTVNENLSSCYTYGTCLSKDPNNQITSETYTYLIDVIRQPEIIYPNSPKLKLLFDKENEISFKLIAKDNIAFNETSNRLPQIGNFTWNLQEAEVTTPPKVEVINKYIDPKDSRNYIFELKTNIHPTSLNKLTLDIPIKFPSDIFNKDGIPKTASFTFNILANLGAEILSPQESTLITKDKTLLVTSKVNKPEDLASELLELNNCQKSVIHYEVETNNNKKEVLEILTPQNNGEKEEKITSLGVDRGSYREFTNKLNFNLKNISKFTKDFLNGNIFGPLKLRGTYSTACNDKNIVFDSEPKTYILLDNPRVVKGKCRYPENSLNSKCEFTISNNTLLDTLELNIKPNAGVLDPAICPPPIITFDKENKLTKKVKVDCLPKEATNISLELRRGNSFLDEVEKRINDSNLLTTNEDAIIADKKTIEVKNAPREEEEEEQKNAFEINDSDSKVATVNGKEISVRQLKDLLFSLGLISTEEHIQDKYTYAVNQAYWKLTCAIDEAKRSTLDLNLRLQTAENPLKCTIAEYEGYPDIKSVADVSVWIEFIEGLKVKVGNDIRAYVNPATIGTIAVIIAWNAILPINAWLLFVTGIIGLEIDIATRSNEVKDLWNNPSNLNVNQKQGWKIGYTVGTLFTALPGILPANLGKQVKVAEGASKLDNFSNLQDLIISEQRTINSLSGLEPTGTRQEVLNNFATFLKDIPDEVQNYELSGLSLLDKTVGELKPSGNKYKLLELFTKDTPEVGNTQILKNILIDEVQADGVKKFNMPLEKDLANAIVQSVDNIEYKPISTYFHGKGYEKISKVVSKENVPRYISKFETPQALQKYNLPTDFGMLGPEQIIEQINSQVITKEKLTGTISSSSMANFVTPTEPIQSLTATKINGPEGLGLGIPSSDFKGLVEIQIDTSKLPNNVEFRLPISVLGNQYFKPTKLNSNSGVTIGNYLEWTADEFSALAQDGIIAKVKGLPKNE